VSPGRHADITKPLRRKDSISSDLVLDLLPQSIEQLSLTTNDYAAIASIVPRDASDVVFWKEFLKTAYEDIVNLLQERNVFRSMQVNTMLGYQSTIPCSSLFPNHQG